MSGQPVPSYAPTTTTYGVLVEFDTPESLTAGCEKVRDAGFKKWDAFTPFPVHGLDRAMGLRTTPLPWLVMGAGVFGVAFATWFLWFTNAHDYPFRISGKPFWSLPANVPIIFEVMVLFAGITAVVGMLALCRLPELYHALFTSRRFRRVTTDRFFICIEAADPKWDETETMRFAESLGGLHVERVED